LVTALFALIVGLSLLYLIQPAPLIIQGEADATRVDMAARVDSRVELRPVSRGESHGVNTIVFIG
jgi:HlyD family secretion protein